MNIRQYQPSDEEALLHILRKNTPQFFHPDEEKGFLYYLQNEREDYYVLEIEGKAIGSGGLNYFPEENLARISWDLIHPNWQRKGIGSKLLAYRLDQLQSKPTLSEAIVRTTQLVYSFYVRHGFQLSRVEKDFWAEGLDLYYLSLPLEQKD